MLFIVTVLFIALYTTVSVFIIMDILYYLFKYYKNSRVREELNSLVIKMEAYCNKYENDNKIEYNNDLMTDAVKYINKIVYNKYVDHNKIYNIMLMINSCVMKYYNTCVFIGSDSTDDSYDEYNNNDDNENVMNNKSYYDCFNKDNYLEYWKYYDSCLHIFKQYHNKEYNLNKTHLLSLCELLLYKLDDIKYNKNHVDRQLINRKTFKTINDILTNLMFNNNVNDCSIYFANYWIFIELCYHYDFKEFINNNVIERYIDKVINEHISVYELESIIDEMYFSKKYHDNKYIINIFEKCVNYIIDINKQITDNDDKDKCKSIIDAFASYVKEAYFNN